jgi:hypothetical protein
MATKESTIVLSLKPAAFQAGLRATVDMTVTAGKAMGRALKEPINAGLKSAGKEIGSMFSDLKSGLKTVGTLGGALAIGTFVKDAVNLQRMYGDIASQVNKVAGNTETWQSVQKMIETEVGATGRKAEELGAVFMEVFKETAEADTAARAMRAIGFAATDTGHSVDTLATATQIAMTKWGIKTPEEALARIIQGTGVGGKQIDQLSGSFEMLAESAAGAGATGGETMSLMLNLITSMGDKAEGGFDMMFKTMKMGTSQMAKLQKAMGTKFKFTSDMSALDRIRATFTSVQGRKTAELMFKGNARIVYDQLAKPFDEAYKSAKAANLSNAEATTAGLKEFDSYLAEASQATLDLTASQRNAEQRMKDDPGLKLDMAIEKIRLKFASPQVLGMLDQLADKLPAFADAIVGIIDKILANPWESLAVVVGGKLAIAFGGSLISEAIAAGMKGLFARMAAVQAASTAASVATGGATSLGVGGAVGAGAAGAGTGAGAVAVTGAIVAGAVLAAGAVGAGAGYGIYKYGGVEKRQNREFDALTEAREDLMSTSNVNAKDTKPEIEAALSRIRQAKVGLDQSSSWNSIVGSVAGAVTGQANPFTKTEAELTNEEARLKMALRKLAEGTEKVGEVMNKVSTTRGVINPPNSNPGAKPVTG